jgi:hypothetical protein
VGVLLLRARVAGMFLPTPCLAMGTHVTIYSNARSRHSPEGTEENQENPDLGNRCVGLTQYARYEFHLVSIDVLAVIMVSNRNALAIRDQNTEWV